MENIILEDEMMGKPPVPSQWAWITQRQETDGKSASIWKFGFIAPDGAEVRVTFHQIAEPTADQQQPPQPDPNSGIGNPDPTSGGGQDVIPQGQPNPDQTSDGVFYVSFFSNRNPEHFTKWDVSLTHEDSLTTWVTITHGLVDFLRKAKPKNLILDDLGNGKLKMVLRSVAMDVVATDPEYSLEISKKHEYRSFYEIKKGAVPSAFHQGVTDMNKAETDMPPVPSPVTTPTPETMGQPTADDHHNPNDPNDTGIAPESNPDATASPVTPTTPAQPAPPKVKEMPNIQGTTVEIGRDYSVTVKDREGNITDRYRGKNPADMLRWISVKGYGKLRMKVVDKETPAGTIAKTRNAEGMPPGDPQSNLTAEHFRIDGNKVIVNEVLPAKRVAAMNYIVNVECVRCTAEHVVFEFSTDKDMEFKRTLVEVAYKRTES